MIWKLRRKSCHNKDVSRTDWRGFTRYPRLQVPQRSSVAQIKRLPVAIAFLVFGAFCYLMICFRKVRPLPTKELKSPEEEEEDQLAAGD